MSNRKINVSGGMNLAYLGSSTDDVTDKLIGLADFYIQENVSLKKLNRRVTFIIAECFQNVVRHGSSNDKKQKKLVNNEDFFQIKIIEDEVRIYSKNIISNKSIDQLDKQIELINSMTKEQLKEMWRELLVIGDYSQKGGAGLGLIEIARKCGFPLQRKFIDIGNGNSDFYLGISMSKSPDPAGINGSEFSIVKEYNQYFKEGIIIDYQGDFSKETSSFLIEMIHANLVDTNNLDTKLVEVVTIAIELIQNISKHGSLIEGHRKGAFSIGENNHKRTVSGSNYVTKFEKERLEEILLKLEKSSIEELKKIRNKRIFEEEFSPNGNANLGLIEMALTSKKNFTFTFTPFNELLSEFSLIVDTEI